MSPRYRVASSGRTFPSPTWVIIDQDTGAAVRTADGGRMRAWSTQQAATAQATFWNALLEGSPLLVGPPAVLVQTMAATVDQWMHTMPAFVSPAVRQAMGDLQAALHGEQEARAILDD